MGTVVKGKWITDDELVGLLEETGPGDATELARLFGRDRHALKKRLDRLCEAGRVTRRLCERAGLKGAPGFVYASVTDPLRGL
jgi:predicted transcriptional regulator